MTGYIDASRPPGMLSGDYYPRHKLLEAPRSIQLGWARRGRVDRAARREEAGRSRTVERLAKLGSAWKVLDIEELGVPTRNAFLTIGPGGVFLVVVKPQGRSRVRLAGDVIQVDGRRHKYVAEARLLAEQVTKALSRTVGATVPVTPVIALAGNGAIDVHGLPKGCLVTSYRELDYILSAYGERIAPGTVNKLFSVARHPVTWQTAAPDAQVEAYKWYSADPVADKTPRRR
jgi:hypothetical protein